MPLLELVILVLFAYGQYTGMRVMKRFAVATISAGLIAASTLSASAYKIYSTHSYGPAQKVVARGACNDGTQFNVRYNPGNGNPYQIYSTFRKTAEAVIRDFCRNHGG